MTRTFSFDIGDKVVCDICSKPYTAQSPETGGFLFVSKAVCPDCAPRMDASIAKYNEQHFIVDRAREGETFHAAVMRWRDGNTTVHITGDDKFIAETVEIFSEQGLKP